MNLNTQLEYRKKLANDSEGMMNYERPLHDMIVHTVKLVYKQLSGELTGTNMMPGQAQTQALGTSNTSSIPTAQANPLASESHSLYPRSTLSTRGIPKSVQKVDCLGSKLWLPDGKPKTTRI